MIERGAVGAHVVEAITRALDEHAAAVLNELRDRLCFRCWDREKYREHAAAERAPLAVGYVAGFTMGGPGGGTIALNLDPADAKAIHGAMNAASGAGGLVVDVRAVAGAEVHAHHVGDATEMVPAAGQFAPTAYDYCAGCGRAVYRNQASARETPMGCCEHGPSAHGADGCTWTNGGDYECVCKTPWPR